MTAALLSTLRTLLVGLAVLCATLAPSNAAAMVACDESAAVAPTQDAPDHPHAASHVDAVADGYGTAADALSGHGQSDDHCSLHACVFGAIADGADGAVWPIGGMPSELVGATVVKTTLDGPRRPPRI